ncbi:MAG: ATP-dependent sacrificial sulfur transferase LarE [Bacteroidales bacterium]
MAENKVEKLDAILRELNSFVVAFSGGVDSSFLLHRSHSLNGVRMTGVTIKTPYIPSVELDEAAGFALSFGIDHRIIEMPFPEAIRNNPEDRCYRCKKILFAGLIAFAKENGYRYVVDGTNADDTGDFRPGLRALREMEIRSPLLEAGLTKNDIREISRSEDLPIWNKPAMACLMTRIPCNTRVNEDMLRMVEKAEYFLLERGYSGIRVRIHGDLARIECAPTDFGKIISNPDRNLIINKLKEIGFRYVSLDLEGYRTGSSNPMTDYEQK